MANFILSDFYKTGKQFTNKVLLKIWIFISTYGILMELTQKYIASGRNASFYDALFNTLGVIFAVLLFKNINVFRRFIFLFLAQKKKVMNN